VDFLCGCFVVYGLLGLTGLSFESVEFIIAPRASFCLRNFRTWWTFCCHRLSPFSPLSP
jgi:hypothetical protein